MQKAAIVIFYLAIAMLVAWLRNPSQEAIIANIRFKSSMQGAAITFFFPERLQFITSLYLKMLAECRGLPTEIKEEKRKKITFKMFMKELSTSNDWQTPV